VRLRKTPKPLIHVDELKHDGNVTMHGLPITKPLATSANLGKTKLFTWNFSLFLIAWRATLVAVKTDAFSSFFAQIVLCLSKRPSISS
jgi:hypothetical protein